MGINFPNTPLVGDIWPNPVVTGQPQYTWDGEKWTSGTVNVVGAVRYDTPQTLTSDTPPATMGQRSQARANVYAAPFDALAYSGMQINGSMEVSQENGGSAITVFGAIKSITDGWKIGAGGPGPQTVQVNQAGVFGGLPNFNYGVKIATTVANASPTGIDEVYLTQRIEGWRVARLGWGSSAAQPITFGFWVWSTRAGMFSGSVTNGAFNRSYTFSYTINAASTWEYKTVTIPGDTLGTWERETLAGLIIFLTIMSAPGGLSAAGVWNAAGFKGVPGTTNCCQTTSDQMYFTGVVVIPGLEAPSAARSALIMRPYDQELVTCKRYWQQVRVAVDFTAGGTGATGVSAMTFAPVMRAAPTALAQVADLSSNVGPIYYNTPTALGATFQATAAAAGRLYYYGVVTADARL